MANMNLRTLIKPLIVSASLLLFSLSANAGVAGSVDFKKRITKQGEAVEGARKAGLIDRSELKSLKKELSEIQKLYDLYIKDKSITKKEAKALEIKLKKSHLNLFRKKYD